MRHQLLLSVVFMVLVILCYICARPLLSCNLKRWHGRCRIDNTVYDDVNYKELTITLGALLNDTMTYLTSRAWSDE